MLSRAQSHKARSTSHILHPIYSLFVLTLLLFSVACGDSPQPAATPTSSGDDFVPLPTQTTATSFQFSGQLDETFGTGGKVTTDLGSGTEEIHAMVVQADGKIVVTGEARPLKGQQPKFTLVRYNADGSLDSTFGDKGIVATNVLGAEYDYSVSRALLLQPDGKLIAAGRAWDPDIHHDVFAAARHNADGSLDETFGDGGKALIPVNTEGGTGADDIALGAALAPDGKIVMVGKTGSYPPDFATMRLNPDGTPDETFGGGGRVVTDFGIDQDDGANTVAIQGDGKILVGGYAQTTDIGADYDDFALARYNADGSLDKTFGKDGILVTDVSDQKPDQIYAISLLPGGKFVVAGTVTVGAQFCSIGACWKYGFGLAQYNADGSLDASFGNGGTTMNDALYSSGNYSLVRLPDGRLATAGYVGRSNFNLEIYNPDGSIDTSIGKKGILSEPFGEYTDEAYAIALQPDGKILVAGTGTVDPNDILNGDFALVRYK